MLSKQYLLLFSVVCLLAGCNGETSPPSAAFQKEWYAGKAELSSYSLQQARYGEIRNGEAVLIFVTEDFSPSKLVKLDEPAETANKTRVLKLNMTKKFATGIYPYSTMLSVFTPVSQAGDEKMIKADCSSQEWCGHTFSQLKLKGGKYNWRLHSYFEKEADQEKELGASLTEDGLWNQIRLNPAGLPPGKVFLLPGLLWQRLSHKELKSEEAVLSLSNANNYSGNDTNVQQYTIRYPGAQRTLQIYFQLLFPHEIVGWQESYPDGFGANKKMLTTKAQRKKTIWLDYWKHNTLADSTYTDTLQLLRYE